MRTEVRVLPGPEELAAEVARSFVELVQDSTRPGFSVALTGGSIADRIHRVLAQLAPGAAVDWRREVDFWWGDERFVAVDSPDRNAGQARAAFLTALGVGEDHVFEVPALGHLGDRGEVLDVQRAAEVYADLLRFELHHGAFDLVMLGLGPDGHVASLFPGSRQLGVSGVDTVAVTDSPKPPPERVSLTFDALGRTHRVWFLVSGAEKAEAVARSLAATGSITDSPARGVVAPEIVWWLDEAAASCL